MKTKTLTKPIKPHDVKDYWDWQTLTAERRETLRTINNLLDKLDSWLANPDTTKVEREEYLELKVLMQERIAWLKDQIRICEDWQQKTMDFDKALDVLKKAFDEDVMRGFAGYSNIIRSEGLLHKMRLKAAIRSIGCTIHLLENHEDGDVFFMSYPLSRLDLMEYIEGIDDDE